MNTTRKMRAAWTSPTVRSSAPRSDLFELSDVLAALVEEYELPADIVIWHGSRRATMDRALSRAGNLVISDEIEAYDAVKAA